MRGRVSCPLPALRSAFLSINYIYLFVAILLEVTGTMLLPVTANFTRMICQYRVVKKHHEW